jgi:hypothetical protein
MEAPQKNALPGEGNIISYCALASTQAFNKIRRKVCRQAPLDGPTFLWMKPDS